MQVVAEDRDAPKLASSGPSSP